MATQRRNAKNTTDEITKALNEIINQNLSIGVSTLGEDINDDHADMKSNASNNWRRGSVSYSQPSSPKGNPSLSPVSSVSSLSDLSTETYYSNDSESCASLNSNDSSLSYHRELMNEFVTNEIIHEHKDFIDIDNCEPIVTKIETKTKSKTIDTLKVPNNNKRKNKKIKKIKKKKNKLTKSNSYEQKTLKLKSISKCNPKKRRNSKDCLDITIIQRLINKSIPKWSISDVVAWIKYICNGKYKQYSINFKRKQIDGKKLFKMNRTMLQSIEIYHPAARKAILAELKTLKKKVRQSSNKQINLYAKTHNYSKKKQLKRKQKQKQKKHQRGISNIESTKHKLNNEMYVIAVKKRQTTHKSSATLTDFSSVPIQSLTHKHQRKYSANISEFLNEWDISNIASNSNINFLGSNILEQTDNFTMIQLSNGKIIYALLAKVEKWTNMDVCKWLSKISNGKFKKFIETFKQRNTNGFDLLNISRVQLQNNIQMYDSDMRNILLKEIKLLKIATKPKDKLLKKRTSAISVKEMQIAQKKEMKLKTKNKSKHRKSASCLSGIGRSQSHSELYEPIQRKLGPRDIGRNKKYKGTKWERKLFEYDFLEEKLNYYAKSECFNKRKMKNPVQHKETVDEIGIFTDFQKPEYTNQVLRNVNVGGWLTDKPLSRRDNILDSLKGTKIPRNALISEINSPIGWKPIKYECKNDGRDFLEEHFWFDGSGVKFEFSFSRLLKCLSSTQLLKLNKQPSPTGYESKLNWLKMLLKLVSEEMELIKKEDALYNYNSPEPPKPQIITPKNDNDNDNNNDSENKSEIITEITIENKCDETPIESDENEVKSDENNNTLSLPETILSESDQSDNENILSPPNNNLLSPDMNTKRSMYKRKRANTNATTLANSTLGGIGTNGRNGRKRTMSIQDINRRRFLSQDSVDSIQAIILNIENKRAQGNKIENVMD